MANSRNSRAFERDFRDITENLSTLQLDVTFTEEEKTLASRLVADSHVRTVTACAHASYLVNLLQNARYIFQTLKTKENSPSKRDLHLRSSPEQHENHKSSDRDRFMIGLIGCGRLGRQLVNSLLTYGDLQPEELIISTRRPETLGDFAERGVTCVYDNVRTARSTSLLFLSCLPSQLPTIAADLKPIFTNNHPSSATIQTLPGHSVKSISQPPPPPSSLPTPSFAPPLLYSFVSATNVTQLQKLLGIKQAGVVRQQCGRGYGELSQGEAKVWDLTLGVQEALGRPSMVEITCPLRTESVLSSDSTQTSDQLRRPSELKIVNSQSDVETAAVLVSGLVNLCSSERTDLSFMQIQLVGVINALVLGHHPRLNPITQTLTYNDLKYLLHFDRSESDCTIEEAASGLRERLSSPITRSAFISRYCQIFQQQSDWLNNKKTSLISRKPTANIFD